MSRQARGSGVSQSALTPAEHFAEAAKVLVGGVSGSARVNPALGHPMLVERGEGPWLYAPDGSAYVDFHTGFGATILGHNHSAIRAAIERALDIGIVHGPETVYPSKLAEWLVELVPSAELVRYANSGSEATMAAIRLARTHTGRNKILKFEGHFHGLHDHVIYNTHPAPRPPAPGRLLTPVVDSGGIPAAFAELVLVAPWNDMAAVDEAFALHGDDIAAVIVEPINYNSGCLIADRAYMRAVREISADRGAVLIYDEILSGFRTGVDCAQGYYGVTPDVTLLGKAVANGVPLAVIAGRRDVMQGFSPLGAAAHSGTYSGHIFGVLAALATLGELTAPGFYDGPAGIFATAGRVYGGLREIFARTGVRCRVQGLGARFGLYFGLDPFEEAKVYQDVAGHDAALLRRFARACFEKGVYFHTYDVVVGHHGFGASHSPDVIDEALNRIESACAELD